jgi:hypothetical protein
MKEETEITAMETTFDEEFSTSLNDYAIQEVLLNKIQSFFKEISTQPNLHNFLAAKITNNLPRDDAADMIGVNIRKICRRRQFAQ